MKHLNFLIEIGQSHLLADFEKLSFAEKTAFINQISILDPALFKKQQQLIGEKSEEILTFEPLQEFDQWENHLNCPQAEQAVRDGQVGCIVLAGGHASRLGSEKPKALFPISLIENKTLLQLICERIKAQSQSLNTTLPLALMTSSHTDQAIQTYLKENDNFELESVDCFKQNALPLLDQKGNWFLSGPGQLAQGPDGNGHVLRSFFCSPLGKKWKEKGIKYISIIMIDNPLAEPFDLPFLQSHLIHESDVSLKAVPQLQGEEHIGLIVLKDQKIRVVEYSEISKLQRCQRDEKRRFRYQLGNTGLFYFNMEFAEKCADKQLPWHLAHKKFKSENKIYKFETFIFDLLEFTDRINIVSCPRQKTFAPLKSPSDLPLVQRALLERDRQKIQELTGKWPANNSFELDACFHFPSKNLIERWQGRELPNISYLDPDS